MGMPNTNEISLDKLGGTAYKLLILFEQVLTIGSILTIYG
jgi:hypothetical protein